MGIYEQIKLLSPDTMAEIHEKALRLLWERGVVFEDTHALETFRAHGAKVEGNTVFLPKTMVEAALAQCPPSFRLEAINHQRDVIVGEGMLIHPSGGEVFSENPEKGRVQPSLADFEALQKIYQYCDEIDIGGYQPLDPCDVDPEVKGLHCVLSSFRHTDKPILSPMDLDTIAQKEDCLRLFAMAFGGDDYLENHYLTWHAVCPNSPFYYSSFATEGIRVFAQHHQPLLVVSAPMTGITSPVYLFSTVILSIAEGLAGLVYGQLLQPGIPVILSASLTYGNLRYATWECASPDTALMLAASVQMMKEYYHLPSRAQTGVTSAKVADYQGGMETMQSFLFTALSGVNLCSQSVGTLANLLTTSAEKTVLDNEMIARVRYLLRGLDCSDGTDDMEALLRAKPCQDFLMEESTMKNMRSGWQPSISDWRTYDAWENDGKKTAQDRAKDKVKEILAAAPPKIIDEALEKEMLDYISFVKKQ